MSGLWVTFLSMSFSGSLLILLLLFCKPFYKNRLSKKWQYYIWLVVIARLLLPVTFQGSLVNNWFLRAEKSISEKMEQDHGEDAEEKGMTRIAEDADGRNVMTAVWRKLWLVWLGAAAVFLIRKIVPYRNFVKYVKAGCREVSDAKLLNQVAQIGAQTGVKQPVELYINNMVSSPMLLGFLRFYIVLPDEALAEKDFQYTIQHEMLHAKRKDLFYKWLVQVAICLHWFNPLVYRMGKEINCLCELSLDEAMIGKLDGQEIRDYGDTLLRAVRMGINCENPPASVMLGESAELLKERLSAMMNYKKYSKGMKQVSLVIAFAFLLGAMAIGAYASPAKDELEEELERQQLEEYGEYGITKEGGSYYYYGELVRILTDVRADSSFMLLKVNPKGTINIRIVRDKNGKIESLTYVKRAEEFSD